MILTFNGYDITYNILSVQLECFKFLVANKVVWSYDTLASIIWMKFH